jgi:hypothetical protein
VAAQNFPMELIGGSSKVRFWLFVENFEAECESIGSMDNRWAQWRRSFLKPFLAQ